MTDTPSSLVRPGRLTRQSRRTLWTIYLVQAAISVLVAAVGFSAGSVVAYSALLGGALYLIPNLYAVWRSFYSRRGRAASPRQVMVSLYASEIGKMLVAVGLFGATFLLIHPLNPFSLFGTFMLLQITGWLLQWKLRDRLLKL